MENNSVKIAGQPKAPSKGEEVANSVTHGIGAALGLAGLVLLVVFASLYGDVWRVVSLSIYGATLVMLYTASTLYHSFTGPRIKRLFKVIDHSSIFLLIAGTYTPITLVSMRGPWGWTLFGLIWGLAIAGITFKLFFTGRFGFVSVIFYVAMGWLVVVALKPMLEMLPPGLVVWMAVGGGFYTLGVIFYVWKKMPFNHAVWHLFVLAGSISHFIGILLYLTRV